MSMPLILQPVTRKSGANSFRLTCTGLGAYTVAARQPPCLVQMQSVQYKIVLVTSPNPGLQFGDGGVRFSQNQMAPQFREGGLSQQNRLPPGLGGDCPFSPNPLAPQFESHSYHYIISHRTRYKATYHLPRQIMEDEDVVKAACGTIMEGRLGCLQLLSLWSSPTICSWVMCMSQETSTGSRAHEHRHFQPVDQPDECPLRVCICDAQQ